MSILSAIRTGIDNLLTPDTAATQLRQSVTTTPSYLAPARGGGTPASSYVAAAPAGATAQDGLTKEATSLITKWDGNGDGTINVAALETKLAGTPEGDAGIASGMFAGADNWGNQDGIATHAEVRTFLSHFDEDDNAAIGQQELDGLLNDLLRMKPTAAKQATNGASMLP